MSSWPSLFISHGAPTLLIEDSPTRGFLRGLGARLGRPRAILCVSAHWETARPALTAGAHPATIHDFHGFPPALYARSYPAPGAPDLARAIAARLAAAGMTADLDPRRGFDHGVWVPLALIYPAADIPVVQLSVQPGLGAAHHLAVGRALAPLRAEGVLILGSGSLTHNLAELHWPGRDGSGAGIVPWASGFAAWMDRALLAGDFEALAQYRTRAPDAARAHPTEEHLLPLHVAAAAGGGEAACLHGAFMFGSLSMAAYAFPGLPAPVPEAVERASAAGR